MRRGILLVLLGTSLGCADPDVPVVVHVPGGPDRAIRVELSVLTSCDEIARPGDRPASPVRSLAMSGEGGAALGFLETGSYGLYGRAWEEGCRLYAAGCIPLRIDEDPPARIELSLEPVSDPRCAVGQACPQDACADGDDELPACGEVRAFPTAEGSGAASVGGRGSRVVEVTTLDDAGEGSLRDALEQAGPRTVVFRVSGDIVLQTPIALRQAQSFVTVAGQTAPGDGIQVRNHGLELRAGVHDVILRHLRIRPGIEGDIAPASAVSLYVSDEEGTAIHDVILDHCSVEWSRSGHVAINGPATNVTVQWSLLAEGIPSDEVPGAWGTGVMADQEDLSVTLHHNLFAHNEAGNPYVYEGGTADVRNNVVYNWSCNNGAQFGVASEERNSSVLVNFVGNVYRDGPDTNCGDFVWVGGDETKIFPLDNRSRHCLEGCDDEWDFGFAQAESQPAALSFRAATPFEAPEVTTDPSAEVEGRVLSGAGAIRPVRDALDQRIVQEVVDGAGRIGRRGPAPVLLDGEPPEDGDHDGVADDWERERGLDPADPEDGPLDRDGNGYTELEDYLAALAGDPACR